MAKPKKPKIIGGDKAHAKFSASGSERWLNCSGSIPLSEKAPPQVDSPYAIEGTEAHECHEFLLKNRRQLKAASGTALKKYGVEMTNHVLKSVLWILNRFEETKGTDLLCETRVDASSFTCEEQFGTVDAAIVDLFGKLTVVDFKYGAGIVVDPKGYGSNGNSQLVYYALGIAHLYDYNFSEVELVVIQPRAYHESGEIVRTHTLSIEELKAWIPVFKDGVRNAHYAEGRSLGESLESWLKPGEWCRFCPAAVICPELKEKAMAKASIYFSDLTGVESVPEPTLVKTQDLGVMLSACDQLETWIEKLRAHAFGVLQSGGKVPGYKLVDKKGRRKWADKKAAAKFFEEWFGDNAFTERKLITPAQIDTLIKKLKKKADRDHLGEWLQDTTCRDSTGLTMVPDSDQRLPSSGRKSSFTVIDV